jgi:glycolate oxidase FAD binding subunit
MTSTEIKRAFADILGIESVCDLSVIDQVDPACNLASTKIACIVYPNNQTELKQAIALANKNKIPIFTCDRDLNWGDLARFSQLVAELGIADLGIIVNTAKLDKLIDHAVGDLTVTCEAGMKFRDLQQILATSGQFLAIDPADPETITLGEIVNTANTGSLRQRYGGVRDMLLGISFVRTDGELVKAGGRVVKNVAGYDLMKLMTGSYGTLGIVSQVTFRLYPLPECDRTIIITGLADTINDLRAKILLSTLTPWAMDILSQGILSKLTTELATNIAKDAEIGLILRFGGLIQGVEEQIRRLLIIAQELNLTATVIEDTNIWDEIQTLVWHGDPLNPLINPVICKVGMPSNLAVENLIKICTDNQHSSLQIHAGSGLGIFRYSGNDPQSILKVRNLLASTGGFLTLIQVPQHFATQTNQIDIWGYTGNAKEIMSALKQKFDPHNLLNPHRCL